MDKLSLGQLVDLIVTSRHTHALEAIAGDMRELRVMFGQAANLALAPMNRPPMKGRSPPAEAPDAELAKQKTKELEASLTSALKERDEARDIATKVGKERDEAYAALENIGEEFGFGSVVPRPPEPEELLGEIQKRNGLLEAIHIELNKLSNDGFPITGATNAERVTSLSEFARGISTELRGQRLHADRSGADLAKMKTGYENELKANTKVFADILKVFDSTRDTGFMAPELVRSEAWSNAVEAKKELADTQAELGRARTAKSNAVYDEQAQLIVLLTELKLKATDAMWGSGIQEAINLLKKRQESEIPF